MPVPPLGFLTSRGCKAPSRVGLLRLCLNGSDEVEKARRAGDGLEHRRARRAFTPLAALPPSDRLCGHADELAQLHAAHAGVRPRGAYGPGGRMKFVSHLAPFDRACRADAWGGHARHPGAVEPVGV